MKDRLGLVRLATWGSFRISLTYLSRELTPGSFEKEGREFNVRLTGYLIFNRAGLLLEGTLKGLRLACVAESQVQPRHITRIVGSRRGRERFDIASARAHRGQLRARSEAHTHLSANRQRGSAGNGARAERQMVAANNLASTALRGSRRARAYR